jgi:hypothetical protein
VVVAVENMVVAIELGKVASVEEIDPEELRKVASVEDMDPEELRKVASVEEMNPELRSQNACALFGSLYNISKSML